MSHGTMKYTLKEHRSGFFKKYFSGDL